MDTGQNQSDTRSRIIRHSGQNDRSYAWYEATYTSDVENSLSNELMSEEFALYIDKSLDENEVIEKVRKELISG